MRLERVSIGEEGEGHSMLMDRKHKRQGNLNFKWIKREIDRQNRAETDRDIDRQTDR